MGHHFFEKRAITKTDETDQVKTLIHEFEKTSSNKFTIDPNNEFKTRLTQMEEAIKLMLESKINSTNGNDASTAHTMWGNSTKKHEEEQQVTGTNNNGLGR